MTDTNERTCLWFRHHLDAHSASYRTDCMREERVYKSEGFNASGVASIQDTDWTYCPYCGGRIQAQDDRVAKPVRPPSAVANPTTPIKPNPFAGMTDPTMYAGTVGAAKSVFAFGKHRGETHEEVAESDPQYIVWAYENVANQASIDKQLYLACAGKQEEEAQDKDHRPGFRPKRRHRDNWGDDFADDDIPFN